MKVDRLRDFNKTIQLYKIMLSFIQRCTTVPLDLNHIMAPTINDLKAFDIGAVEIGRLLINACCLYISQVHEQTKDVDDEFLDQVFEGAEYLDDFTCTNGNMSLKDKKREVRNALAHAGFDIVVEKTDDSGDEKPATIDDIYLSIDNKDVKGKISLIQLERLTFEYKNAYYKFLHGDNIRIMVKPTKIDGQDFDETLDKAKTIVIKRNKDDTGMPYEEFEDSFQSCVRRLTGNDSVESQKIAMRLKGEYSSFDIEVVPLNEKEKEFLKQYYGYLGDDLLSSELGQVFNQMLDAWNYDTLSFELLKNMIGTLLSFDRMIKAIQNASKRSSSTEQEEYNDLTERTILCTLQAPILYANNLLARAFYELDYVRELNAKSGGELFDYFDIKNLPEMNATVITKSGKKKETPIKEDQLEKLGRKLQTVGAQIRNLDKQNDTHINNLAGLKHPKNNDPQREYKTQQANEFFKEYPERRRKLKDEEADLQAQIEIEKQHGGNRKNSYDFFRHLRHCLAHGRYKITYGDFNDLGSIKYSFKDVDKEEGSYAFELTEKQLQEILAGFQEKVNECDRGFVEQRKTTREMVRIAIVVSGVGRSEVKKFNLEEVLGIGESEIVTEAGDKNFGDE